MRRHGTEWAAWIEVDAPAGTPLRIQPDSSAGRSSHKSLPESGYERERSVCDVRQVPRSDESDPGEHQLQSAPTAYRAIWLQLFGVSHGAWNGRSFSYHHG